MRDTTGVMSTACGWVNKGNIWRPESGAGNFCLPLLVALATFALLAISPAIATAAPANDDFSNAALISGSPVTVNGSNVGATFEFEEPEHGNSGGVSIWYRWTAPTSGRAYIDTCGSAFDTMLAVYTGTQLNQLNLVAQDDDGACGNRSRVVFSAAAGTEYRIAIDGFSEAQGAVQLTVGIRVPPANDDFANAQTMTGSNATTSGSILWATREANEPDHDDAGSQATVWYRWTAPASGAASVDVCDNNFNPVVAVYRGTTLSGLTKVASGDCLVDFGGTSGTQYRIAVAGPVGGGGNFVISVKLQQQPPNDHFANAQVLTGNSVSVTGTTFGATRQAGEPLHGDSSEASIWYRWVAPSSGNLFVDTCGSIFDTLLAVYTGSNLNSLTRVAENDDGNCGLQSSVALTVQQGVSYSIAVDGWEDNRGSVKLKLAFYPHPANDNFGNAQAVSGLDTVISGTTAGATTQTGESNYGWPAGASSVWYQWSAPQTGLTNINLCGEGFGARLRVFTGSALNSLQQVATGDCSVSFDAVASTTYRIAVASSFVTFGEFEMKLAVRVPPPNDNFSSATVLTGGQATVAGTTRGGSREAGEPDHNGSGGTSSVWYRWTAPGTGVLDLDVCENDFGSSLAVYTGTAVNSLHEIASAECGLEIPVSAGVTYSIAVDNGGWGSVGSFELTLAHFPSPANDSFATAEPLGGYEAETAGSTRGATREDGEPDHFDAEGTESVWYAWTAPATGDVSIDVCENDFETVIAAYRGSGLADLSELASGDCEISLSVVTGDLIHIAVDGREGAGGTFTLKLQLDAPLRDLSVTRSGSGMGSVISSGGAIACGDTCEASLDAGSNVVLVAKPAPNSTFVGWRGACSGVVICQLTMDDPMNVEAEFDLNEGWEGEPFSIAFDGAQLNLGQLDISLVDSSDDARGTLEGLATADGEMVALAENLRFEPQTSTIQVAGSPEQITVRLRASDDIEGRFDPRSGAMELSVPLSVELSTSAPVRCLVGPINATLSTSGPELAGGSFGAGPFDGSSGRGSLTAAWSSIPGNTGGLLCQSLVALASGAGGIWLDGTAEGLPTAPELPRHELSVTKSGGGSGLVVSVPSGVSCGSVCSFEFEEGESVRLTASPTAGSTFEGWSGACSGSGLTCDVVMSAARSVTANFAVEPVVPVKHALSVTKSGGGSGSVVSVPSGVSCGSVCSFEFEEGESVRLTASPMAGSTFEGWSGACSGSGLTCDVVMSAARSVTANFAVEIVIPPPKPINTKIKSAKVSGKKRKATFAFAGSGGSGRLTFQCRLDRGRYSSCRSPKTYKRLKKGRHTFWVRARDASGAVDKSPAKRVFRIR